jgi:hypothetical protein
VHRIMTGRKTFSGDVRSSGYLLLALLILLAAAFLRLFQLPHYPPGPHYDEGAYLLITRAIAFGGARFFPIVEAYQGREVLYMYLSAPFLHLIKDDIFTLRLVSASANLITVAATIALGRSMFRGQRGLIVGLTAGALIALSFPQFWLARQAFRAVTLPLMQALALLLLWRGLRARNGWGWLIAAGLFAGGAIYTYMASRLFPLWLGLAGLVLLLGDRRRWAHWLPRAVVFFGVTAAVLMPMVIYALQKPEIFFGRLYEVTQTGEAVTLWESILLHLQMFFIRGDSYFRYNIPERPYLTPPEGALMLVGLAAALVGVFRRRTEALERPAYLLALLSPLMVIPSVISVGGLPPSHMRSLGMIPLADAGRRSRAPDRRPAGLGAVPGMGEQRAGLLRDRRRPRCRRALADRAAAGRIAGRYGCLSGRARSRTSHRRYPARAAADLSGHGQSVPAASGPRRIVCVPAQRAPARSFPAHPRTRTHHGRSPVRPGWAHRL